MDEDADSKSGEIFCNECDDFIQSNILTSLRDTLMLSISEKFIRFKGESSDEKVKSFF